MCTLCERSVIDNNHEQRGHSELGAQNASSDVAVK